MAPSDDASIPGDALLLRRFVESKDTVTWDYNRGVWSVRSGAVVIDPDGVSCYLDFLLAERGLSAADVAASGKGDLVAGLRVSDVRSVGCGVVRDPQETPANIGPAHALITFDGDAGSTKKKRAASKVMKFASIAFGEVKKRPGPPA